MGGLWRTVVIQPEINDQMNQRRFAGELPDPSGCRMGIYRLCGFLKVTCRKELGCRAICACIPGLVKKLRSPFLVGHVEPCSSSIGAVFPNNGLEHGGAAFFQLADQPCRVIQAGPGRIIGITPRKKSLGAWAHCLEKKCDCFIYHKIIPH